MSESASALTFGGGSQAGQDFWIYQLFGAAHRGTFLDVGCQHPIKLNNTVALERLGWQGLLVDLGDCAADVKAAGRTSPFVCADAKTMDWPKTLALAGLTPDRIDYVSLDVDNDTPLALAHLLDEGVHFLAATIEHDAYRVGPAPRALMRRLLLAEGYLLAVANVKVQVDGTGYPFEDWWVHRSFPP